MKKSPIQNYDLFPSFPKFIKLNLDQKSLIQQFTPSTIPYSDFTFTSLWCWNTQNKFGISLLNNNLIIRFTDYITNQYHLSFLGKDQIDSTIIQLLDFLATHKMYIPYLKLIPEYVISNSKRHSSYYIIKEDNSNHDYIYSLLDLSTLSGRRFASRRNNISKIERLQKSHVVKKIDISDDHLWSCILDINAQWFKQQIKNGNTAFNDMSAVKKSRLFSRELFCTGIFSNNNLVAYNINELSSNGFAISLFEHCYPDYSLVLTMLQRDTARLLIESGFKFWNWQQDLGIQKLRSSKLLSCPTSFNKKFIIVSL